MLQASQSLSPEPLWHEYPVIYTEGKSWGTEIIKQVPRLIPKWPMGWEQDASPYGMGSNQLEVADVLWSSETFRNLLASLEVRAWQTCVINM